MLFSSVAEMKSFGLLNKNFSWDSISPYIRHAELQYVVPILGQGMYNVLEGAYMGGSMSAVEEALYNKVAYLLYNATMWEAFPHLNIYISELGVQENESKEGTSKPAAQWRYREARQQFATWATMYAEQLYVFLQNNISDYPDWGSSVNCSLYNSSIIRNNEELGEYLNTQGSVRFFVALRPFLVQALQMWVYEIVPEERIGLLLLALQVNGVAGEDVILLEKVRRVVAWGAYVNAIPFLNVRTSETGVYVAMMGDGMHDTIRKAEEDRRLLLFQANKNAQAYQAHLRNYWLELNPPAMPANNFYLPCNGDYGAFSV